MVGSSKEGEFKRCSAKHTTTIKLQTALAQLTGNRILVSYTFENINQQIDNLVL